MPALLLSACDQAAAIERYAGPTMGAGFEVKWVASPDVERQVVEREVQSFLRIANDVFSTWAPDSVISRFNAHASTEPFAAPAEHRAMFASVLRSALEVAALTDGAFDPTIQPVVELLGFGRDEGRAPTDAELASALAKVGWRQLEVLDDGRVRKLAPAVQITLSGLVPGWAADQLGALLARLGVANSMVDVGGEIACRGSKPGGRPWIIGIERPAPPGEPSRVHTEVALVGGLATSGSYRNFHLVGDEVVHHLLDPKTGHNVRHGWASVSVRADDAGLADALATAFMVRPGGAEAVVARLASRGVRALFLAPPDANGVVRELRVGW
ncbi:MAG: FAD:protein FMN transferase [Planctomycetota bacterium]